MIARQKIRWEIGLKSTYGTPFYVCTSSHYRFVIQANALELNVWTSTILDEHAKYDDANKIWTITVATCDKKLCTDGKPVKRVVKPKHLVLATGHSGGKLNCFLQCFWGGFDCPV